MAPWPCRLRPRSENATQGQTDLDRPIRCSSLALHREEHIINLLKMFKTGAPGTVTWCMKFLMKLEEKMYSESGYYLFRKRLLSRLISETLIIKICKIILSACMTVKHGLIFRGLTKITSAWKRSRLLRVILGPDMNELSEQFRIFRNQKLRDPYRSHSILL
jgi:hypothetical protein